jgi:hypothetical protein
MRSSSIGSIGTTMAAVVVISITLAGLLLVVLDMSVFRPISEERRLRAQLRWEAKQVQQQTPATTTSAADRSEPGEAAVQGGVVIVACGGEPAADDGYAMGGREVLVDVYRNARAGKGAAAAGKAAGRALPRVSLSEADRKMLSNGMPRDYLRAMMARVGAAVIVARGAARPT